MRRYYRKDFVDWLSDDRLTVFATVTLKQAIPIDIRTGLWCQITPENVRSTAWILRDRVNKALLKSAFKRGKRLPFLVFHEDGNGDKRHHLHIVTSKHSNISMDEYNAVFRSIAQGLDWVYHEIDVRPIERGTASNVLRYSLKEGIDAFIPEASFVPCMD